MALWQEARALEMGPCQGRGDCPNPAAFGYADWLVRTPRRLCADCLAIAEAVLKQADAEFADSWRLG